ncbi:Fasciclin domain-containing protein [Tangfeifania diversioriginum]|uniref:Fasciclin domain-containing protein n=1 Tax=Tangfeifania diversioriginum TaxID=1168035 RepID=A0A1M6PSD0_9BACT|nr:fasciclin domain-containing protein [Tangfeifania diversioriginum]SHK10863.1 Fasciclin domain-containing protein [Tangfeifania diversioriginum]
MKKVNGYIAVLLTLIALSCNKFEYKEAEPYIDYYDLTVNEFVTQKMDSLKMFNEALKITGLSATIESGDYTIFAPFNSTFNAFLSNNNYTTLQDVPVDELTTILKNQIIEGKKKSPEDFLTTSQTFETIGDKALTISITENTGNLRSAYIIKVNGKTVLISNIELKNVVLHAYQDRFL